MRCQASDKPFQLVLKNVYQVTKICFLKTYFNLHSRYICIVCELLTVNTRAVRFQPITEPLREILWSQLRPNLVPRAFSKLRGMEKALASTCIFCNFIAIGQLPHTVNLFNIVYPHISVQNKLRVKVLTFNVLLNSCITLFLICSYCANVSKPRLVVIRASRCQGLFSSSKRPWERG